MDYLKFIPIIVQIFDLIPKIQAALRAKTSIVDLLQQFGPEVLPIITQLGSSLFPNLPPAQAAEAGALKVAPDVVRDVQVGLNRLGITDNAGGALATDGSYGTKTKEAVTKFQTAHGLTADGWAGKLTQAAISTEVAKLPVTSGAAAAG